MKAQRGIFINGILSFHSKQGYEATNTQLFTVNERISEKNKIKESGH